jgi:hypothetical protein
MAEVNEVKKLARVSQPTGTVEKWIEAARTMDTGITYQPIDGPANGVFTFSTHEPNTGVTSDRYTVLLAVARRERNAW